MQKVLIIGATSAMAEACARIWAARGAALYLVGRRSERLQVIADDLVVRGAASVGCYALDCCDHAAHAQMLDAALGALGGIDVALIAHGSLPDQRACEDSVEATLAALEAADLVVAVVAADPVGVSRFLRAHADLRAVVGARPVRIVVNKTRTATLGMDARGQVRRTFERYASAREVWFVPWDPKAADAATLAARPVAEIAGRSALAGAVRRFVGEAIDPPATSRPAAQPGRARSRERARGAVRGDARTA